MISKITAATRDQLSGKWIVAIATMLVYNIIVGAASSIFIGILVVGHLSTGAASWSLSIARGEEPTFERLMDGFKNFIAPLVAYILFAVAVGIGIVFLIIPGIIIALGLSQTFYILADDPERDGLQALQDSWSMMKGHKTTYFMLCLRYFLLGILCIFTLGLGFFVLAPYIQVTNANFYLEVSGGGSDSFDAEYIVQD
jgi:uncharacterized membrane protein